MAQDIFIPPHYPAYRGWLKSITDSQWHLIVAERDPAELYDWPDDLPETRNVVESVAGKTAAAEINAKLWSQVGQANHTKANFNPPTKSNQLANAGQ
jgi:predicted transcriptional regulator